MSTHTPDPLSPVTTVAEVERDEALAWNVEVVRLLKLARDGRAYYAKCAPDEMKAALESEAELLNVAVQIALGDRDALKGLLPVFMWGDIDGAH